MNDFIPPRRGHIRSTPRAGGGVSRSSVDVHKVTRASLDHITQPVTIQAASPQTTVIAHVQSRPPLPVKKPFVRRLAPRQTLFGTLAVIVLLATGYVGLDTWLTNRSVQAQLSENPAVAGVTTASDDYQAQEGKDTTPLPKDSLADYAVAASLPRALYIDKLDVAARILPMGVNKDNSVQAPINIFDAGWYNGSVKPGEPGAVFIDGHSSADGRGLFGELKTLVVGDELHLEKGDGTQITYRVVHTETVDRNNVDMNALLRPYGDATRGLNLVTCIGSWVEADATLTDRVLVYTEQL